VADVFISYARNDAAMACRVAKALKTAGLNVWWDADLPAHRAYSEIIERNLEDASAVVVLWSKTAAKSQWVRAEADFARNADKLVQVRVDGTMPPMPFNQIQCADLKGWKGSVSHPGWAKLKSSVEALVSGEEKPKAAPSGRGLWDRVRPYRWWAAAGLALLIAMGAVLFLTLRNPPEEKKPVLAVLPFKSLDSRDESLVAGMWEDTRQAIGRNPQIVVLGPNTAEKLAEKGQEATKRAADYMLEASVRTAGDKVRVSADLVRTKDGEQVWSQDFDRRLDDIFALQSQIASEIEGHIRGRLAVKGGAKPEHIATTGEVYALYADARAKLRKRDNDIYPAACEQLEQIVKLDPNFAPGWATLSQCGSFLTPAQKNFSPINSAEADARKAIDLAPNLAAGHAALALALKLRGPVARSELERAVQLDPNDYETLNWLGGMLEGEGRRQDAISFYQRAVQIEPLFSPVVLNLYNVLRGARDEAAIARLLDFERSVGGDYFATAIEMQRLAERGDLARAANIGLQAWSSGRPEARAVIGDLLRGILIELDFGDAVVSARMRPPSPMAPYLWRDDPKALDMIEATHMPPKMFMTLSPMVQNAGRVSLLRGRPGMLAERYMSLGITPETYAAQFDDPEDFPSVAPALALSLQHTGHASEAQALLSLAATRGEALVRSGNSDAAGWLSRIYAVQGRKNEALSLLTSAVNRRWLPSPPILHNDLARDPAFAMLKGDPRFEALRQQILGTIARERAQVDERLLIQLKAG
jgi:TolB-like protein/Tfp pilus assembly protein PilF